MNKKDVIMKQLILIMLMAFPCITYAQTNLDEVFEMLSNEATKDNSGIMLDCKEKDMQNGEYQYVYSFSMKLSKAKNLIERINSAFRLDAKQAYKMEVMKAGEKHYPSDLIGVGKRHNYLGGDNDEDIIYACFQSDENTDYRYAYVLTSKTINEEEVKGKIYKIYGKNPNSNYSPFKNNLNASPDNNLLFMNGFEQRFGEDSLAIKDVNELAMFKQRLIRKFSTLRLAFLKADNDEMRTALAYKIYELCKKGDEEMTDTEIKLCVSQIEEIQKMSKDSMINGMLELAAKCLKSK